MLELMFNRSRKCIGGTSKAPQRLADSEALAGWREGAMRTEGE